ncbi:retrovirus-related pol polyprotein from transposon TNT 1-94, partial [Tanacetum coccineum]
MTESPLMDSGFAVPVFSPRDDPIACLNKAMDFLTAVASSRKHNTFWMKRQLAFLADPGVPDGQAVQTIIPNTTFQTEDLDTYDSDYDDIFNAQAVLMDNISNYGFDVISEDFEKILVMDFSDNEIHSDSNIIPYSQYLEETQQEKANKEHNNESVTAELERYKERVKTFEQRLNIDLSSREKMIDSQMDDMIREKLAMKEQVDSLEQNLSKQIKEKECLLQTFTVFKSESKEKEDKYMENEIDLEKKIKELDNILFKVGYQNPFHLKKAQRIKQTLYDGIVISDKHVAMHVIDDEETLIWEEKSRSKIKPSDASPIKIEAPKELPKVSLVNESLKKLKFHLVRFDNVVKIRTTPDARTEGMFKLDLEPLAPRLLQNREAHIEYLKYTQEQVDILRGIVKLAKAKQPLDKELDFALQKRLLSHSETRSRKLGLKCSTSNCGPKPTGNKKNDRISSKPSRNMKNKLGAQPRKVNKKNRVVEPICDVAVKHSLLNENSEPICANCKKSMFDGVHDMCLLDFVENVNSHAKSAKKHKKQNIWKPTGHVFTEVELKWKPAGKTFTIVGNLCPLTRITSANVVPPKKTTSNSVDTPKPAIKVYSRNPKNVKNIGSSKKAKIVESNNANHSEPNHTWGSNATDIPSYSSLVMTVRFRNENIARIKGYGDNQLGNVTISRVYYVEGLGHNLFFVGQFCDVDLEVAFRKNTCFIRNLEGVDLLSGSRDTNLYTISLDDILKTSPICLLSKASKTKRWLWHRRLSHLNFGTLNKLAKDGLARGIPRLKFQKDHMCSACALGKSKKSSHQPKAKDTNQDKIYLLHMDLCGPMRVASINEKRYILVIVDDYSRFTWVRFLRTKDEPPEAIIKCIKNIQVRLNNTVRNVRTDNGTEFVNQILYEFYENVGISHQTSVARTPQQNDVVERQNRTLVEAARTMLIFSKAPLFLWAEAINTACYTQNRSLICLQYNKTPYLLMQDKKPDLSFFYVFGAL